MPWLLKLILDGLDDWSGGTSVAQEIFFVLSTCCVHGNLLYAKKRRMSMLENERGRGGIYFASICIVGFRLKFVIRRLVLFPQSLLTRGADYYKDQHC